jgi:hypothetical protein
VEGDIIYVGTLMIVERKGHLISKNARHQENLVHSSFNRSIPSRTRASPLCQLVRGWTNRSLNGAANCRAFLMTFEFNYIGLLVVY